MKNGMRNEPLCYFVRRRKQVKEPTFRIFNNFRLMTLMHYGFFNNDSKAHKMLIEQVFDLFWKSDADVLEAISSSTIFHYYARPIGLIKLGQGMSFKFGAPKEWNLSHDCNYLKNWHLTHFSGDAFSFI